MDEHDNRSMLGKRSPGRPRSIPESHFETILQRYQGGDGYRRLATYLRSLGVSTTHTAVRRLIKGEGAYAECRNQRSKALDSADEQKLEISVRSLKRYVARAK